MAGDGEQPSHPTTPSPPPEQRNPALDGMIKPKLLPPSPNSLEIEFRWKFDERIAALSEEKLPLGR